MNINFKVINLYSKQKSENDLFRWRRAIARRKYKGFREWKKM